MGLICFIKYYLNSLDDDCKIIKLNLNARRLILSDTIYNQIIKFPKIKLKISE